MPLELALPFRIFLGKNKSAEARSIARIERSEHLPPCSFPQSSAFGGNFIAEEEESASARKQDIVTGMEREAEIVAEEFRDDAPRAFDGLSISGGDDEVIPVSEIAADAKSALEEIGRMLGGWLKSVQ